MSNESVETTNERSARRKRPVVVLGATGAVGQRFLQLLTDHPWFEVSALAASEQSAGRPFSEACRWGLPGEIPPGIADRVVRTLDPEDVRREIPGSCPIAFSALPAAVAREVESRFAQAGYAVVSNVSAYRYEPDVPLVIPEVNPEHLLLIDRERARRSWPGFIVTNPNCTTAGIALAVKPLDEAFTIERVFAATLQAVSGAGYPGVASLDALGNVVPYIDGEEEKIERETRLLLGRITDGARTEAELLVSAQAHRVPVIDGHTVSLSLQFERRPSPAEAIDVLSGFRGSETVRGLPSAPDPPIIVRHEADRPQPRLDRDAGGGMAISVGRVRTCPLLDLRMVVVSHNTVRGAAGASLLNAELLVAEGWIV